MVENKNENLITKKRRYAFQFPENVPTEAQEAYIKKVEKSFEEHDIVTIDPKIKVYPRDDVIAQESKPDETKDEPSGKATDDKAADKGSEAGTEGETSTDSTEENTGSDETKTETSEDVSETDKGTESGEGKTSEDNKGSEETSTPESTDAPEPTSEVTIQTVKVPAPAEETKSDDELGGFF